MVVVVVDDGGGGDETGEGAGERRGVVINGDGDTSK